VTLVKVKPNQHPFPTTIARTKRKISETIKDGASSIDFKRLKDMGMMTNDSIRSTLYGILCFGSVCRQRLTRVRDPPVKRDDHSIDLLSQMTNVGFEHLWEIHSTARKIGCGGTAAIPIVAKQANAQPP
jgi:hypothetical protein